MRRRRCAVRVCFCRPLCVAAQHLPGRPDCPLFCAFSSSQERRRRRVAARGVVSSRVSVPPPPPAAARARSRAAEASAAASGSAPTSKKQARTPTYPPTLPSPTYPLLPTSTPTHLPTQVGFTGRCWMAEGYPISLEDFLPILDCMAHLQSTFAKARPETPPFWRGFAPCLSSDSHPYTIIPRLPGWGWDAGL